jgi:catechol 2,3-dioxygenase-like lactoylglutathione lyase family enzyme
MHLRTMLSVRNLPESIRFYRSALGFELVESLGGAEEPFWAYVKKGTAELMLAEGSGPAFGAVDASLPNGGVCLYFYPESVAELESLHADLSSQGQPVSELETTDYGHRLFTLRDPDGYTLSFGVLISPDLWPRPAS